ncbi:MAG: hypothetical protein ACRBFS_17085 [Aureispira sp.]
MPVQGKSVPRYGSTSNYEANVEASFNFGALLKKALPIAGTVGKALLGAI